MSHRFVHCGRSRCRFLLLLGDRYDDVLSLWLPQTDVLLDEASFQHMYEELERHRALKAFQESLPQVPLPPDSVDGEERPADDVDPDVWSNRDFVYDQLVSLTGVSLVAEVLDTSLDNGDKAMFDQSLQLLEGYRRCVEANGLVTLPAYVVTTMCETLGFGDGEASFDKMRMVRHACFDMTEVMLTRIPDTDLRYDLAVALMSLDLDGYFDRAGGQVRSMVDDAETT